jgi:hypothetical protein
LSVVLKGIELQIRHYGGAFLIGQYDGTMVTRYKNVRRLKKERKLEKIL